LENQELIFDFGMMVEEFKISLLRSRNQDPFSDFAKTA